MGLLARPLREMIAIDADYPAQMALRRTLLAERPADVFAAIPGSEGSACGGARARGGGAVRRLSALVRARRRACCTTA